MNLTKVQLNQASFIGRMVLIEHSEKSTGKVRTYTCKCEDCGVTEAIEGAGRAMGFLMTHMGHKTRIDHKNPSQKPQASTDNPFAA